MSEAAPSRRVIAVIDFAFELLKRALVVGALQYAATEAESQSLQVVATIAKFMLGLWVADKAWTAHDVAYGTDKYPRGSRDWWIAILFVNLSAMLATVVMLGWLSDVIRGAVR
jgi:hypothetical protein